MKETKDIISAYHQYTRQGIKTALATVVHLQGSAYRRPGARMLVSEDGRLTGAISGGCLEGDALRKAQLVLVQQKPMLVTYDTTDDDDTVLGVGLGCNGIISILIEPVNAEEPNNPIRLLETFLATRSRGCIATVFSLDKKALQPGTCLLVTAGLRVESPALQHLAEPIAEDATAALNAGTAGFKNYEGEQTLTAFFEILEPPVSLLIFGAGNDSQPLVQMANILGWETTVIDGRQNYATNERFKDATRIIISKPADVMEKLLLDNRTVTVLMTHNYIYDIAILKHLLPKELPYIGVLGPKKKMQRMMDDLQAEGIGQNEADWLCVYGPSGLDLGSETSEEIALSIIAEIKAVLSQRQGTSLRNKKTSIHV